MTSSTKNIENAAEDESECPTINCEIKGGTSINFYHYLFRSANILSIKNHIGFCSRIAKSEAIVMRGLLHITTKTFSKSTNSEYKFFLTAQNLKLFG